MSEVAIFSVGCVMFVLVATAMFLYGWLWFDGRRRADEARAVVPVETSRSRSLRPPER